MLLGHVWVWFKIYKWVIIEVYRYQCMLSYESWIKVCRFGREYRNTYGVAKGIWFNIKRYMV